MIYFSKQLIAFLWINKITWGVKLQAVSSKDKRGEENRYLFLSAKRPWLVAWPPTHQKR